MNLFQDGEAEAFLHRPCVSASQPVKGKCKMKA